MEPHTNTCQAVVDHRTCSFKSKLGYNFCGIHINFYQRLNRLILNAVEIETKTEENSYAHKVVPKETFFSEKENQWKLSVFDIETSATFALTMSMIVRITPLDKSVLQRYVIPGV